ncbi:hypothetical protein [Roseobacter cerasinus]|nr:hypothetical protein [Roseobacter cerasinus]
MFQSAGTENSGSAMRIREDHPVFEMHFPGFPVVPGSMTVAMVLQRIGQMVGARVHLVSASFLAPVRPNGEPVTLKTSASAGGLRFRLMQGAHTVCRGAVCTDAGNGHG